MRVKAWLAVWGGLGIILGGCESSRPVSKAQETGELTLLGERVFAAFAARDLILFEPLAVWGVPPEDLHKAMRQVDLAEARASLRRLAAIPKAQRPPLTQTSIDQLRDFLANPHRRYPQLERSLNAHTASVRAQHQHFFRGVTDANATLDWAQARDANIAVREVRNAGGAPEASVEIFFSIANRNYKLQLNTCLKLPGLGWRVAENVALIDLTTEAALKKMWHEDFPAAQVLARDQKKKLLVDFTGSDWCPPCIALHNRVFSSKAFREFAKDRFVLVTVDFPRNRRQPDLVRRANTLLAREFKVEAFPTVLLLDANGTELRRVTGYTNQPPAQYLKSLAPRPKPKSPPGK